MPDLDREVYTTGTLHGDSLTKISNDAAEQGETKIELAPVGDKPSCSDLVIVIDSVEYGNLFDSEVEKYLLPVDKIHKTGEDISIEEILEMVEASCIVRAKGVSGVETIKYRIGDGPLLNNWHAPAK